MKTFEAARTVSALDVAERYAGIIPTRTSRRRVVCRCPFPDHEDRHPSCVFTIEGKYAGSFICTCSHHGNSIDFVSQYFNLPPLDAAKKICNDFGLAIDSKPDVRSVKRPEKKLSESVIAQAVSNALTAISGYIKYCQDMADICFHSDENDIFERSDFYADEAAKWIHVRDRIYFAQDESDSDAVNDLIGNEYFEDIKSIIRLLYEYDWTL